VISPTSFALDSTCFFGFLWLFNTKCPKVGGGHTRGKINASMWCI